MSFRPWYSATALRYYPPEKQGLRLYIAINTQAFFGTQILSSRKTRIKTQFNFLIAHFHFFLRYYPPEKQGLRHVLLRRWQVKKGLRYYPPEKQGLRHIPIFCIGAHRNPQILSSRKTRIKTIAALNCSTVRVSLRYYPPEKQGLRPTGRGVNPPLLDGLRYYPPEKQGLRRILAGTSASICRLRYYPPEKQGLRPAFVGWRRLIYNSQILSSRKTRIKTLTSSEVASDGPDSDTILQKNKD